VRQVILSYNFEQPLIVEWPRKDRREPAGLDEGLPVPAFSANLSLLFGPTPMLQRFAAAREAGFTDVESWWPFPVAVPSEEDLAAFLQHASDAGVRLRALNLFAGDMPAGDRGVLSDPARVEEFRANVSVVRRIAEETGCRYFNALYGKRVDGITGTEQDRLAHENLAFAARELSAVDGVILLEALKNPENGSYPLLTLADADAVRVTLATDYGATNVALLFDTFHLAGNGVDLIRAVGIHGAHIGHVQIADFPGRGAPGTGEVDFPAVFAALDEVGYAGWIGAEFVPGDRIVSRADLQDLLEPVL
jgi:hydroxypyruvate isomerase